MGENRYAGQIKTIRDRGGDVIVSFGGEAGTELAIAETNVAALEAKYQSVIHRYKLTWLDFDIEGDGLSDAAANRRRNAALAELQEKDHGLVVSFTLPVDPEGISEESQSLLGDAVSKGLKIHSVNVMTMDFGRRFSKGRKMSEVAMASAVKAYDQCRKIVPGIQMGLTPMIGRNDQRGEIFTTEDALALRKWAEGQPWVCSLSFWSVNRDNGGVALDTGDDVSSGIPQKRWEFTLIFKSFTRAQTTGD
ncbi:MAG TPA: glycosyl hydrolase family 18 protein [Verrucomicrobiae bacterium]|nr:glycosyl hydrolase family 18 protein [Verrucomicrobiae bacterium]